MNLFFSSKGNSNWGVAKNGFKECLLLKCLLRFACLVAVTKEKNFALEPKCEQIVENRIEMYKVALKVFILLPFYVFSIKDKNIQ